MYNRGDRISCLYQGNNIDGIVITDDQRDRSVWFIDYESLIDWNNGKHTIDVKCVDYDMINGFEE